MSFNIKEGLQHISTKIVEIKDTALSYGSGTLEVFATPAMVALMENAAMLAVADYLSVDFDTVGIEINIEHIKASGVGAKVSATAILAKIEGKRLFFLVSAFDEGGEIGKGTHTRFIIEKDKFMSKLVK